VSRRHATVWSSVFCVLLSLSISCCCVGRSLTNSTNPRSCNFFSEAMISALSFSLPLLFNLFNCWLYTFNACLVQVWSSLRWSSLAQLLPLYWCLVDDRNLCMSCSFDIGCICNWSRSLSFQMLQNVFSWIGMITSLTSGLIWTPIWKSLCWSLGFRLVEEGLMDSCENWTRSSNDTSTTIGVLKDWFPVRMIADESILGGISNISRQSSDVPHHQ